MLKFSKKNIYRFIEYVNLFLWLSIGLYLRRLITNTSILYFLGFGSNFFAAIYLMFNFLRVEQKMKKHKFKLDCSFFYRRSIVIMVLLYLGELIQKHLLNMIYDPLDLWASLVGVVVSIIMILFVERFVHAK